MDFLEWLRGALPSSVLKIFGLEELAEDGTLVVPLSEKWHIQQDLARLIILLYRVAEKQGIRFRIVEGCRSSSEQNRRFLAGDTNARAGQSPHNPDAENQLMAMAVDFETIPPSEELRTKVGKLAEGLGLIWGGRFKSGVWAGKNKDTWHLELPDWKRRRGALRGRLIG